MAVFRVEKNNNYTVMCNTHLRDTRLSLKAVGLLSKMLSLTDDWNYTTRGLASICKEGVDAISASLKELEACGYLVRRRLRDNKGRITDTEYVIYETPIDKPDIAAPCTENPDMDMPNASISGTGKPAQLNTNKSNTEKSKTDLSSTDSILSGAAATPTMHEAKRREVSEEEYEDYKALIQDNIGYDALCFDNASKVDRIDEIVDLMVETVCSAKEYIRIAGEDMRASKVRARLLKLEMDHIIFVLDCMEKNTTKVRNIKQYLLTSLYNAPMTIGNYYTSRVNYDKTKDYGGAA